MGWLISDKDMMRLQDLVEHPEQIHRGVLEPILRNSFPVKVEDVHIRPLRWVQDNSERGESEPSDEG